MKRITWDPGKNEALRADEARGRLGFEECLVAIEDGRILDDIPHPLPAHQRLLILEIEEYAFVVPYVENDDEIFLKTLYPSRRMTAHYLRSRAHDE